MTTGRPIIPIITREISPPARLLRNPIIMALGAKGNTIGQSNAGRALGITFWAIPWKAGTISFKEMPTPYSTTLTPAEKMKACTMANTSQFCPWLMFVSINCGVAKSSTTRKRINMVIPVDAMPSLRNSRKEGNLTFSVLSWAFPSFSPIKPANT